MKPDASQAERQKLIKEACDALSAMDLHDMKPSVFNLVADVTERDDLRRSASASASFNGAWSRQTARMQKGWAKRPWGS